MIENLSNIDRLLVKTDWLFLRYYFFCVSVFDLTYTIFLNAVSVGMHFYVYVRMCVCDSFNTVAVVIRVTDCIKYYES